MDREKTIVLIIFVIVLLSFFVYKFLAPGSGLRSRLGGSAVELEVPADIDESRPIGLGKTESTKWISYYDKVGDVHLKEYSDWGVLEGHYVLRLRGKR